MVSQQNREICSFAMGKVNICDDKLVRTQWTHKG